MASWLLKSVRSGREVCASGNNSWLEMTVPAPSTISKLLPQLHQRCCRKLASSSSTDGKSPRLSEKEREVEEGEEEDARLATSGISRPLSDILKQLNKKVPDSLVRVRSEDGFAMKYIPWHVVNRIMNLHAPEWSGEVRNITYSADGKSVSLVYRVTLYGTDAEIYREATGTASVDDTGFGGPVQKAEAMAFRRACARFGLGLHLYHEDMS